MSALGSQVIPIQQPCLDAVREVQNPQLQDMTDMKSLREMEVKKLATIHGQTQYFAFDELARRIRDNSASWRHTGRSGGWGTFDCSRTPNVYEMEWVFLKWSLHLNDYENYEVVRLLDARFEKLEGQLDEDPESLEIKYFNAIGEELRRAR